jgi:hypothetical protein
MFNKIVKFFDGKKTYITGFSMILYGVIGWKTGALTPEAAIKVVLDGLGFMFVRKAIANK